MSMRTKKEFIWPRGCSCLPYNEARVMIPAGAPVVKEKGEFFIPANYFEDHIVRHDATYYGCRVPSDNIIF